MPLLMKQDDTFPFHVRSIDHDRALEISDSRRLEAESSLQIDTSVGRTTGERPLLKSIRDIKKS